MQAQDFDVACRKTTGSMPMHWRASLGLCAAALAVSPTAAFAQQSASQDRMMEAEIRPSMSGIATSGASLAKAPLSATANTLKSGDPSIPASRYRPDAAIFVAPENASDDTPIVSQTFQSADLDQAVIHDRNIPGLTKVMTSEAPAPTRVTGVTLWDEIVPPTPPGPVGAAQTAPVGLASPGGK